MTDLSSTIIAKSDQLNADDLISGSITIEITSVRGVAGEQPIAIGYKGDNGKPWMPCKSMRRVLVAAWGADGLSYVGRSLTLYRDPSVTFGGLAVGGIRVSHMSHINKQMTVVLSANKKTKKPFVINPLEIKAAPVATKEEPQKTYIVALNGRQATHASFAEYQGWMLAAIDKMKPEQVDGFMQRNNPFFAEYRKDHQDDIAEIIEKLDALKQSSETTAEDF